MADNEQTPQESNLNVRQGSATAAGTVYGGIHNYNSAGEKETGAPSTIPRQLRTPVPDFVGRKYLIESILESVKSNGVCISGMRGMAGVGKTELALLVAARLAPDYPDGQIFIDLHGADPKQREPLTTEDIMMNVVSAFERKQERPDSDEQLAGLYRSVLAGRRVLLLFDNAASSAQVRPLVPPESCLMLVTSRQRIELPGLVPVDVDTLPRAESIALLLEICPRIGEAASTLAELCADLPLALRIVASTLKVHAHREPHELVERLRDEKKRLKAMQADDLSVEASIAVSEELLAEDEVRARFRELSVFPADFDEAAALAVWGLDDASTGSSVLDKLVAHSLVRWDEATRRYVLHDLVRLYADSRLDDIRRHDLRRRHAEHFRSVLAATDGLYRKLGDSTLEALRQFDIERANIDCAFRWISVEAKDDDSAARLCSSFLDAGVNCLSNRQLPTERYAWLGYALSAAERLDDNRACSRHAGNQALILKAWGQLDEAMALLKKVEAICAELGDRAGLSLTYGNQALILHAWGRLDEAMALLEKQEAICAELGDRAGLQASYGNQALILKARGRLDEAMALHKKEEAICAELGDRDGLQASYGNQALILKAWGRLDEALALHKKEEAICAELGDRDGLGRCYWNQAIIFRAQGDKKQALLLYDQTLEIEKSLRDPDFAKDREFVEAYRVSDGTGDDQ